MAGISGPNSVKTGMDYVIDSQNTKSSLRSTQQNNLLVDPHTWTPQIGASGGYGANGSSTEQALISITDDPWGGTSVVWTTTPDATSGADGGWNSNYYTIDPTKMYRYSVWVRRHTAGTGGTFYFGMNPAPIRNDTGAVQSNPYFTYPGQGSLVLNQWYLVVAHVFPQSYSGGRHPDSGWYTLGNKIGDLSYGNIGTSDARWNPGTTSAQHRTYHYYTTNTASGLTFAYPRLDLCDGKQPSIADLIGKGESTITNLVASTTANNVTAKKVNITSFDYIKDAWVFDGNARWIDMTGYTVSGNRTVSFWSYPTEATTNWRSIIDSQSGRYIIGTLNGSYQLYTIDNWRGGPTATLNTWQHIAFSTDGTVTKWYKNGVYIGSYTGTVPAIGGIVIIGARYVKETAYLSGKLSKFQIYKRALSANEIRRNFYALRSKYGV